MLKRLPSQIFCAGSCRGGSGAIGQLVVVLLLVWAIAQASAPAQATAPTQATVLTQVTAPAQDSQIEGVGYTQGRDDAPVQVVELLDFGCSVCAAFAAQTYPALRERYVVTGKVRWQAIPFVLGAFPRSSEAARAAACAHEQGAFWPMHDLLFERRGAWTAAKSADSAFLALAGELGLDEEVFSRCYDSKDARERVEKQTRAARRLRVRGTPTFVIGEEKVPGALALDEFSSRIEAVLSR